MPLLGYVHILLNTAGLLLWLKWREERLQSRRGPVGGTLASTLRRAGSAPAYRWASLAALCALLLIRPLGYWQMGATTRWTPTIDLCAVVVVFRSDKLSWMLSYSACSFLVFLAKFYFCLLLISAVNRKVPDTDPIENRVRAHLGWLERWPAWLKLLLPFLVAGAVWASAIQYLTQAGIQLPPKSSVQVLEQALLVGAASFLVWKYLIAGLLLLHLIGSYIYFGNAPFWSFISTTARNLLVPIRWLPLQLARIDFAPLVGAALVLALGEFASRWLPVLYSRLPL